MKVRIKQKTNRYGQFIYAVQYRKLFCWKTFDEHRNFENAVEAANKLATWDKIYYNWEDKKDD